MASLDSSIFRKRAIEKYMRRKEMHVILRLVSPPMFLFLWILLLLAVCGGVLVALIQVPVLAPGKGIVVQEVMQQKVNTKQNAQQIIVLLLLSPDQQKNLKAGQSVSISIMAANITFNSTVENVQPMVMSPTDIRNQYNLSVPLAQTISGPSMVASATVQPASLAKTYLGSECDVQVKIGSQSVLSLVPGIDNFSGYLANARKFFNNLLPK